MTFPVVLDIDGSVGTLAGEQRMALSDWQESLRFGCGLGRMAAFGRLLDSRMPPVASHGTVFMGSGDFHHLSWPLIARCIRDQGFTADRQLRVVVLDNHPDNMRFPFGVHCGSWVRRVALMPEVSHVYVAGITSGDIGWKHCWENYLRPLRTGKLSYWSCGVDIRWADAVGLGAAFEDFDDIESLADKLARELASSPGPTYLSIDKDVFASFVVRTNWDQGGMRLEHARDILMALGGQLVGSDMTGDVSSWRYETAWKRWMSAGDGQDTTIAPEVLARWQAGQAEFNAMLLPAIAAASIRR